MSTTTLIAVEKFEEYNVHLVQRANCSTEDRGFLCRKYWKSYSCLLPVKALKKRHKLSLHAKYWLVLSRMGI